MKNAFNIFLITLSIVFFTLAGFQVYLRLNPSRTLAVSTVGFEKYRYPQVFDQVDEIVVLSNPIRIQIEDLGINLPIFQSRINNDVWETTDKGASYLVETPVPGDKGNSVIYGHNWNGLFANLVNTKSGQIVKVEYEDGSTKEFVVDHTSIVGPDNSEILAFSEKPILTIYTCTGFLDSQRFVVVATLKQ